MITSVILSGYALSASIWMPNVVTSNASQFGFFGVALALVTWFSGAATCIIIGASAGVVLAEDEGPIGRLVRGAEQATLTDGAPSALSAPNRGLGLREAFRHGEET